MDKITCKTPAFKRDYFEKVGLNFELVEIIIADPERDSFFKNALESKNFVAGTEKTLANYFTTDVISLLEASDVTIEKADPDSFAKLVALVSDKTLTSRVAKDLLPEVVFEAADPKELAENRGLLQNSNEDELREIVKNLIAENETVADEYRSGKEAALKFFVGQGMKATKGSANPNILMELLKQELSS